MKKKRIIITNKKNHIKRKRWKNGDFVENYIAAILKKQISHNGFSYFYSYFFLIILPLDYVCVYIFIQTYYIIEKIKIHKKNLMVELTTFLE